MLICLVAEGAGPDKSEPAEAALNERVAVLEERVSTLKETVSTLEDDRKSPWWKDFWKGLSSLLAVAVAGTVIWQFWESIQPEEPPFALRVDEVCVRHYDRMMAASSNSQRADIADETVDQLEALRDDAPSWTRSEFNTYADTKRALRDERRRIAEGNAGSRTKLKELRLAANKAGDALVRSGGAYSCGRPTAQLE